MSHKRIAVLYGGDSAEREVSLRSGQAVVDALQSKGIDVVPFDPSEREIAELPTLELDGAMIMLHGRGGEDGSMQGALELLNVRHTGSGVLGSALAMDKVRSKRIFEALQLPTPEYRVIRKSDFEAGSCASIIAQARGAYMVKPSQEGSSIGMAKVNDQQELNAAIEQALRFDDEVLIEQYIDGEEYTVAVLNGRALPSIRMTTPHVFYDYDAKYLASDTNYFCPSGLDEVAEAEVAKLALTAFEAVGADGWGRVDFMRDKQGQFYLLEVNTVPGMTAKSLVPMAAQQAGLSFADLCLEILAAAEI